MDVGQLKLVTAATAQPVSLAEARKHLEVSTGSTSEDAHITRALKAATDFCQRRVAGHRQFMPATFDLVCGGFPSGEDDRLFLPRPRLRKVVKVSYVNSTGGTVSTTGGTTTFSSTHYTVCNPDDRPGWIEPAYGKTWPSTRNRPDAVTVRFQAGSATTAATTASTQQAAVPDSAKQAILLALGHFWENREAVVTGTISSEVDMGVDALLGGHEHGDY